MDRPWVEGHDLEEYRVPLTGVPLTGVPLTGVRMTGAPMAGRLSFRAIGDVTGRGRTPLVLLHGFTQTSASWAPVLEALRGRFPVVLPDAPGHGGSSGVRADLWQTADLLAQAVPNRATWVGYSMGGRTALHLALTHPGQVERLVLISTSAGIDDPARRAARRTADEALATRIENEGTERFLTWWLAQPLFATLAAGDAGLEDRVNNPPAGLASSLRLAGAGAQEPLWPRLGQLGEAGIPVLLIVGELDHAYRAHAERMADLIGPLASTEVVAAAGHACHLERPGEVAAAIANFYESSPTGGSEGQADGE